MSTQQHAAPSRNTELWSRIDAVLATHDLLTHPYYQAWSHGELTRDNLAFYGAQYYQHVAAFPTYLTALHSRLPEGPVRRQILANALDEEGLDQFTHSASSRSHADLWKQFTAGMSDSETAAPETLDSINALVGTYRELAANATLPTALGAFYAYESQVPRVAQSKLDGLKAHYGSDKATCEYFALHVTADVHHSSVWKQLIDQCVAENPACAEEVLAGVSTGAAALWQALDGIEAARAATLAA